MLAAGVLGRRWYSRPSQHCGWPGVIPVQSLFTESCLN